MTYYLVHAKALVDLLPALKKRLDEGEIMQMKPFGHELQEALMNARVDDQDVVSWVELDYNDPPLKEEREAVLDEFFTEIKTEEVDGKDDGWKRIDNQPFLWDKYHPGEF
jgi:hypothetical protein